MDALFGYYALIMYQYSYSAFSPYLHTPSQPSLRVNVMQSCKMGVWNDKTRGLV